MKNYISSMDKNGEKVRRATNKYFFIYMIYFGDFLFGNGKFKWKSGDCFWVEKYKNSNVGEGFCVICIWDNFDYV